MKSSYGQTEGVAGESFWQVMRETKCVGLEILVGEATEMAVGGELFFPFLFQFVVLILC